MRLSDLLALDRISTTLQVADKPQVLEALAGLLARGIPNVPASQIVQILKEREALTSTGVGDEVAIPHGKSSAVTQVIAALAIAPAGVEFEALDQRPVKIFVAILAPEKAATDHLRAVARSAKLLRDASVRDRLIAAKSSDEILQIVLTES